MLDGDENGVAELIADVEAGEEDGEKTERLRVWETVETALPETAEVWVENPETCEVGGVPEKEEGPVGLVRGVGVSVGAGESVGVPVGTAVV